MSVSIGRIVHYVLSEQDAIEINRRRTGAGHGADWPKGAQAHAGNAVQKGEIVPVIVLKVWGEHGVNGQALLDGNDSYWITSRLEGTQPGTWHWPERVAEQLAKAVTKEAS